MIDCLWPAEKADIYRRIVRGEHPDYVGTIYWASRERIAEVVAEARAGHPFWKVSEFLPC